MAPSLSGVQSSSPGSKMNKSSSYFPPTCRKGTVKLCRCTLAVTVQTNDQKTQHIFFPTGSKHHELSFLGDEVIISPLSLRLKLWNIWGWSCGICHSLSAFAEICWGIHNSYRGWHKPYNTYSCRCNRLGTEEYESCQSHPLIYESRKPKARRVSQVSARALLE